jgi:SAM-dependent methyltransferase
MSRLILGSGKWTEKLFGDIFCDIREFDNVDVVHDLNRRPWPWRDNTFLHVSAIHLVEHLPDLISFMDEAWRVLQPGGSIYIETPEAGGNFDLTHTDPTHVRCYRLYTLHNYFSPEGIQQFGYTDRPWGILKQEVNNGVIIWHASAIKR